MPRIYQCKKNNPYILPENLYKQMIYFIRDYDRIKVRWQEELHATPRSDGQPRGTDVSDPTAQKGNRRLELESAMAAVEQPLFQIPEEYRGPVMQHIKYGECWPDWGNRKTWNKYQSKYIYHVALWLKKI